MKATVNSSIEMELDKSESYTPTDTDKIMKKHKELTEVLEKDLKHFITHDLHDDDTNAAFERGRII